MTHPLGETHAIASNAAAARRAAFPYEGLTPGEVETLRDGAADIRRLSAHTTERMLLIGNVLNLAKTLLGHGRFGRWLNTEIGWPERTAQRFMRAAEVFGSKNDTVSVLEPSAVYKLSAKSTPETVRNVILERLERGEPLPLATIQSEVGEARKAANKERAVARAAQRGVPITPPETVRARHAARFLLTQLGDNREKLAPLLIGVDAAALLAALRDPVAWQRSESKVVAEL